MSNPVKYLAASIWIIGVGLLDGEWFITHGFDFVALFVGVIALLPIWAFIAKEFGLTFLGQKISIITGGEVADAGKKIADAATKAPDKLPHIPIESKEDADKAWAAWSRQLVEQAGEKFVTADAPGFYLFESKRATPSLESIDPNLALVALRIEIERKVRVIAALSGVRPGPLSAMIRDLRQRQVLSAEAEEGLQNLVRYGNDAAHGARVEPNVAGEVLRNRAVVLNSLDKIIQKLQ